MGQKEISMYVEMNSTILSRDAAIGQICIALSEVERSQLHDPHVIIDLYAMAEDLLERLLTPVDNSSDVEMNIGKGSLSVPYTQQRMSKLEFDYIVRNVFKSDDTRETIAEANISDHRYSDIHRVEAINADVGLHIAVHFEDDVHLIRPTVPGNEVVEAIYNTFARHNEFMQDHLELVREHRALQNRCQKISKDFDELLDEWLEIQEDYPELFEWPQFDSRQLPNSLDSPRSHGHLHLVK